MAKYQYVDNNNDVLSTDDSKVAGNYAAMGYREAGPQDIRTDEIKQHYAGAWNAAKAFGYGALSSIPGYNLLDQETSQKLPGTDIPVDQTAQNLQTAHPVAYGAGEVAGGTAAFATGEGALVDAGMEGASLLASASRGAIVNTMLGTEHRVSSAIINHATTQAGSEHVWADIGLGALTDAAIGGAAALPGAAISKGATALRALGKAADGMSNAETRQAILNYNKVSTALEAARHDDMAQMFEQKGFDKMNYNEVKAKINSRLPDLEAQYNEIKAGATQAMPPNQIGVLADNVGNHFAEWPREGQELVHKIAMNPELSVQQLHDLRIEIDSKINYGTDDPSSLDRAYWNARQDISQGIHNTLRANDMITNGARSDAWVQLDKEYSNLQAIKACLGEQGPGKIPGLDSLKNMKPVVKLLKWTLGIKGHMGAFIGGEAFNAALKTAEKFQSGEYKTQARALARVFNSTADKMSNAVAAGLYGTPHVATQLANITLSHDHFDDYAAKARWITNNPQEASANMSSHMDALGADTETNGKMAQRAVAMYSYLASQLPPNPTMSSIMPTHAFMPQDKKAEWMDMMNIAHDPTHALVNPTAKNLAFYKAFYPEMYQQTANACIQQLQNNPDLPIAGRMWSARVLGQPVDSLTSPLIWNTLSQGRQQVQQRQQQAQAQGQAGQKAQSGNSGNSAVTSNATSLQHLQGKA